MARVKETAFPLADYPTGVHSFGPMNVGNQVSRIGFEIARCTTADPTIWPNETTTLYLAMEGSTDNGQTWTGWGGWGAKGGIHVKRDGTELATSWTMGPCPAGTNRRIRFTVTIENGPLRSFGQLMVE